MTKPKPNAPVKVKINSNMLQIAREYRRISQTELSERVGVSQAAISKIEAGITQEISEGMLEYISIELDFPQKFFLQDEAVTNIGSSALYNRGRKKITVSDMKWIEANINLYRWIVKKLLAGITINNSKRLPMLNIDEGISAASAARKLRAFWKLPTGPVRDLTATIEDAGVIIIPMDFNTRHLDGTCMWLADSPPLIFVNENLPADRYRWTICHELGHLVMHSEPRETQEREADDFASEFLIPSLEIKNYFKRKLNLQLFSDLKSYWKVSMSALVRKAYDLRQMTARQYRSYNINIRRLGTPEPQQFHKEMPSAWKELIEFHANTLKYNDDDFRDLLLAPKDFIEKFQGLNDMAPRLSLVK